MYWKCSKPGHDLGTKLGTTVTYKETEQPVVAGNLPIV